MTAKAPIPPLTLRSAPELLRARTDVVDLWLTEARPQTALCCVAFIAIGAGAYGAAMGWWRSPLQAVYTGLKLPLAILGTTLGNALLNAMVAPLLGLNFTFRQSQMAILLSFTITAIVLGGFSPLAAFIVFNTPPLTLATTSISPEYGFLQLTLTAFVATAGIIGTVKLLPWLRRWTNNLGVSLRVLFAWLAVNLLLGSQICWVLRPFLWDPNRPAEFVGPDGLHGSFFETVFEALGRLIITRTH
jgi:hypothetical protein